MSALPSPTIDRNSPAQLRRKDSNCCEISIRRGVWLEAYHCLLKHRLGCDEVRDQGQKAGNEYLDSGLLTLRRFGQLCREAA